FIHLAELLYQRTATQELLLHYADLIEETAWAMSSMLTWDETRQDYSLAAPIWIAQEIYEPRAVRNPTFELAYWREGLRISQLWRERLGRKPHAEWQEKIQQLA